MKEYKPAVATLGHELDEIRNDIITQIKDALEHLGGKVCIRHYHDFEDMERNTYFEVDNHDYGRELFIETASTTPGGEIEIQMRDTEDDYNPVWSLSDFNASEALWFLSELEDVIALVEEDGNPVVTEYDPDFESPCSI